MNIRFATFRDVPAVANIAITSLQTDEVFGFIYRYRKEYAGDHRWRWEHRLRGEILDPHVRFLVVECPPSPRGSDNDPRILNQPVAFAIWRLNGSCAQRRDNLAPLNSVPTLAASLSHGMSTMIMRWATGEPRDIDMHRLRAYREVNEELEQRFYKPYKESYHLEVLCTGLQWRRRGAATMLVRWAIEEAASVQAILGTEASSMAIPFYEKLGFAKVGELGVEYPDEPDREKLIIPVYHHFGSQAAVRA